MELHGKNLIGYRVSAEGSASISAFNPALSAPLTPAFYEATSSEIAAAGDLAAAAAESFRDRPAADAAAFLDRIAEELSALGDPLLDRFTAETGLPRERAAGELARTTGQLRMFASLAREGSWVDARIDHALPDRKPLPKPDLRRMLVPLGPVAVFGASNFPLAFSVAGGDTASAFAARNPVVCKAHPAHPGTSEMAARAILAAARACSLPDGVFSLIHGADPAVSLALVRHPAIRAVGFTGSLRAGRALFDAASQRPDPIFVYAEMGSVNPIFILPGALAERSDAIADGLRQSVNASTGQMCTCPGLVFASAAAPFAARLRDLFRQSTPATMLHPGILRSYESGLARLQSVSGVASTASTLDPDSARTQARPTLLEAGLDEFLAHPELGEEVFGPSTLLVHCDSPAGFEAAARRLEGSLTATIHGTPADLESHRSLVSLLAARAGRILFNGFPTGVEVCPSMNHGGPYPATTDSKFTSVGTAAILRFARPVCFQNFPQSALPVELRDGNPAQIWRTVDGRFTHEE